MKRLFYLLPVLLALFLTSFSYADNNVDKIVEYWDVSFSKAKNGGRVIFTRVITNNDDVDRESYSWELKIKYRFIKYR